MHSKLFLAASFLSTALAASPDPILSVTPNAAQASQIDTDLSSYVTSLTAQPQYTSVLSVLSTGLPKDVMGPRTATGADLGTFLVGFAVQSAYSPYTALPSDVQSYLSSVGGVGISILSKDLGSAAAASTTSSTVASTAALTGSSTASATAVSATAASAAAASNQSATPTKASAASTVGFTAGGVLVAAVVAAIAML